MDPRPAATVIVARPARTGVEVLIERRAPGSRFAPGFVVFPGGLVEPGDEQLGREWFGDPPDAPRACAIRELHEETGLLITGSGVQRSDGRAIREVSFLPPHRETLPEVARWVAPDFLEVRFDARFFAVGCSRGLEPSADGVEIERAWWALPDDVLEASYRGEAPLMWPTLVTLEKLADCETVPDVLELRIAQLPPPAPGDVTGRRGAWQRPEGSSTRPIPGS